MPALFGHLIVPRVVLTELQRPQTPLAVRTWMTVLPSWLDVRQPRPAPLSTLLHLGAGERDAILLATESQAELLLLDDQQGRQAAQQRGLPIMGTLGVLEQAARRELLNLSTTLTELQSTNFWMHPAIIEVLLARDATRKTSQ